MKEGPGNFYVIGGTLRHDAACYVERQADGDLFDSLRHGEFSYLLTARQMGKSSLMVRTAARLRERGVHVVVADLTAIGQNITPEQWYDGLMLRIGRQLGLEDELEQFWNGHGQIGPCQRLFTAIHEVVLPSLSEARAPATDGVGPMGADDERMDRRLVIFVDEIDTVRSLPFSADEFFAAIRECYNRRTEDPDCRRLTFCLSGVATPSDLIQNPRLTPFNIGRRIELHDFTEEEAQPLGRGLGLEPATGRALLKRVMHWTGGHPYLTQRLCKALCDAGPSPTAAEVDRLCASLFFSHRAQAQDDNLMFVQDRLLRSHDDRVGLLTLYDRVRRGRPRVRDEETNPLITMLHLSGVVRVTGGYLVERNRIYRKTFSHEWVRAHMPDAEVQRQRRAFWRGVIRTSGIAVVVVAMVAGLALFAVHKAREAREAYSKLEAVSLEALVAQARLGRLAGQAGQRFEGLKALESAAAIARSPGARMEVRNEGIACLALPDLRIGRRWNALPPGATGAAFSRDLERYARSDAPGNLFVHRVADDTELLRLPGVESAATRIEFSPDGAHLAAWYLAGQPPLFRVWNLSQRAAIAQGTNVGEQAFDFSSDGRLAAFGEADGRLHVFDLKTSSNWLVTPPSPPRVLRFRPAAREVAMSGWGSLAVEMVDVESGHSTNSIHVAGSAPALAWSGDGKRLAVACPDRKVRVWEMGLSAPPRELEGHQAVPTQLAFSAQGRWLASSGPDSTVRLWDPTRHGKPLVTFPDAVEVRQLQFSSDGRLAGNVSGSLQWWDIEAGAEYSSFFESQARRMKCLDVDPSSRFLAAAHEGGVAFWELDSSIRRVSLGQSDAKSPRFNPATGDLYFADIEGVWRVRVVRPATNSSDALRVGARELLMRSALVSAIDCAADGKSLAVMWEDRLEIFDAGMLVTLLAVRVERGLTGVALSPDGRRVAATHGRKGEVWVWDLSSDRRPAAAAPNADAPRTVLRAPGGGPVVFSPSGDQLAVGTETACQIWNGPAWQPEESIRRTRPSRRPALVSFSPDATLLAFTTDDARVQLVKAATHEPLAQLESPRKEPLVCLRFTPDGMRLVGTTTGGSIDVWNLAQLRAGLARLNLDFPLPPFPGKNGTASLPRSAVLPDGTTGTDSPIRGPRDTEPPR